MPTAIQVLVGTSWHSFLGTCAEVFLNNVGMKKKDSSRTYQNCPFPARVAKSTANYGLKLDLQCSNDKTHRSWDNPASLRLEVVAFLTYFCVALLPGIIIYEIEIVCNTVQWKWLPYDTIQYNAILCTHYHKVTKCSRRYNEMQ